MASGAERRRATVHDVAEKAGVSLATVDRVLNGRGGVRAVTVEKVEAAVAALDFTRDVAASLLARGRDLRLRFLIPGGGNEFMASLHAGVSARRKAFERMQIEAVTTRPLDADALARAIDGLEPAECDCAVIVAIEHSLVVAAVARASRRGVSVMTLVSDLPGSMRRQFIGIDNIAAGRTAASLLGRFCSNGGKIGLIAGSLELRDHRERLGGFRAVLAEEFPLLVPVGPIVSHDRGAETRHLALALLNQNPDLVGIYNLGAGNAGLLAALKSHQRTVPVRVVAHELSPATREGLLSGLIDVVLDQNPDGEIEAAITAARTHLLASRGASPAHLPETEHKPVEIGIFLRDNLR